MPPSPRLSLAALQSPTVSSHEVWMRDGDGSSIAMSHGISRPAPFSLWLVSSTLTEYWRLAVVNYCISLKQLQQRRTAPSPPCRCRAKRVAEWRLLAAEKKRWRTGEAKKASLQGQSVLCASQPSVESEGNGWEWNRERKEGKTTGLSKRDLHRDIVNCVGLMDKPVKDTIELLPSLLRPTFLPPVSTPRLALRNPRTN